MKICLRRILAFRIVVPKSDEILKFLNKFRTSNWPFLRPQNFFNTTKFSRFLSCCQSQDWQTVKGKLLCLSNKSEAKLEASSFRRYDLFYECFRIFFILWNLHLVNIISQNFLEIITNFYKKILEFRQILGQQCEKREFFSINFSFKLSFRVNLKFFLYFLYIWKFFSSPK